MAPSTSYSTSPIDEHSYDSITPPYDPRRRRDVSAHRLSELPVHGSPSPSSARPLQGFEHPCRRSSDPIVDGQSHSYHTDDGHSPVTDFVFDHTLHAYHLESYPLKLSEYPVDVQGSFSDQPSINNTRTYDLEERRMDSSIAIPHYPPPEYTESPAGWNEAYYDTESYCEQLYSQVAQSICDSQYSTSNSLYEAHGYSKDHASSQPNHAHVSSGMHIDISTGNGHGQHVDTSISFKLTADHDRVIHDKDQDGCVDMSQLTLHSERPPISSYSELSAQMSYYNSLNSTRQSKSSDSSAPSTPISATTQDSKPPKSATTPPDWKANRPGKEASTTLRLCTPPPSSKTSTFEAWTPPIQVKTEERSPPLQTRRKHLSSPSSSTRSSSTESRRSRTLSPSSRSQGVLKTIMMKRGGSEQKKQNLACLFCRERKIACGRPPEGSDDPACNQCLRRSLECRYPTESRRGQHKRNAKKGSDNGHDVNRAK
ncbi:hypothetical protein AX14_013082 [Amanita brunnescens Koide BX004]|nr:hypothetical protein AX14_013082 [Amanita brunnescens Koide BX004]